MYEYGNSNTCIDNKLAFYRYMYSIDIYRTINFSIKQLSKGREGEGGGREGRGGTAVREGGGRGREG